MMTENGLAIFKAESRDQGENWSALEQISNLEMRASHPRIVKTEAGFFILWTESDGQQLLLATQVL